MLVFGCLRPTVSLGAVELSYSTFKEQLAQGKIASITMKGDRITGIFKDGPSVDPATNTPRSPHFFTTHPAHDDIGLMPLLENQRVNIHVEPEGSSWLGIFLSYILPWLFLGLILFLGLKIPRHRESTPRVH